MLRHTTVLIHIILYRLGDVINDWRKTIDLEAVPVTEGPNLAVTLKVPFTYCWSPALIPKPADWPSYIGRFLFFLLLNITLCADNIRCLWLFLR